MSSATISTLFCIPLLCFTPTVLATPAVATLTAVNEPDFNTISLEFEPPALPTGRDISRLSGSIEVLLEIDPVTDRVSELSIIDGNIQGTAVEMSGSTFILGSYDLESSALDSTLATPDPPGIVDPLTGEFDSSQHSFTVDSGDLSGEIRILGSTNDIAFNFNEEPIGGTGIGTGTVTLTPTASTPTSKTYNVDVRLPIGVDQNFETEGFTIPIRADGTAKMVGPATVEIIPDDPFALWAEANGIAGTTQPEDSNGDGVSNGIQWALGLDASQNPFPHLLQPGDVNAATVSFSLSLPASGTASPILVTTGSNPLEPFSPVGTALVSPSGNPIPAGTSGEVTVRIARGLKGFVQLSVPD